jgi:hypothetical protein
VIDFGAIAVGVHFATYHFDRGRGYREVNPGVYARADRWQAGFYSNSHGKFSAYSTYAVPLTQRIEAHAGIASGYNSTVVPVLVFTYRLDNGLRIGLIPSSPKGGSGGIHFAYQFSGKQ